MVRLTVLVSSILGCLVFVDASSLGRSTGKATLSFSARINKGDALNVADKERSRARAHSGKHGGSISVTNAIVTYTAQVGVGNPATEYTLLVDTGSSNTWIGASKAYKKTSTSKNTGNNVSVPYGSGSFSGEEWMDTVTLGKLVIKNQSIGVASFSTGFSDLDGVLGIGPVDLTADTVNNATDVPTVTENLFRQGEISEEVIGIYYVPVSESGNTGKLTFGGYDKSVITSSVQYTPLTKSSPASYYWGIDQSISYGGVTILSSTSGIVDTGTTLILIATDAFQKYQSATGSTLDNTTGLLKITSSQYSNLKPLMFHIGGRPYNLSPNAQIWPRSLNTAINGHSSSIYLVVNDIGSPSGTGLDFVDGYSFLERFYHVLDTTNGRIGFATTAYTDATTN